MKIKEIFKKDTVTGGTVANYFRSPFYLWCNLFAPKEERDEESDYQNMITERGKKHEKDFISKTYPGMASVKIETTEDVIKSLKDGTDVLGGIEIFDLETNYAGIPDVLERKEGKSKFGNFYFIVKEIKSAKNIKIYHIMQAAFYNLVIGSMQSYIPNTFYVINKEGTEEEYLFADYKDQLLVALEEIKQIIKGKKISPTLDMDYPWNSYSEREAFKSKDISLINGVSGATKQKLNQAGLFTIDDLNKAEIRDLTSIRGIGDSKANQFKRSAEALVNNKPIIFSEVNLPQKKVEIFFDLEATMPDEELEVSEQKNYLFGMLLRKDGKEKFIPIVAHKIEDEEKAFREFVEFIDRQEDFIIYYFHHFEKTQLTRLCSDYPISEELKDKIFNNMRDIRIVVKDSVMFPTTKIGLKEIAKYLGFNWRHKDVNAQESMAWYFDYVEKGDKEKLQKIIDYNEDDCVATRVIKDWICENCQGTEN